VWAKTDGEKCIPKDIALSPTGDLYIAAEAAGSNTFGTNTISPKPVRGYDLLLKYDSTGNNVWAKHLGGMAGRAVSALPDSGCFYAGSFNPMDPFVCSTPATTAHTVKSSDLFFTKVSASGQVHWLGFPDGTEGRNALPTTAAAGLGGYYLGGSYDGTLTIGAHSSQSGPHYSYSFVVKLTDPVKQVVTDHAESEASMLGVFPNPAAMQLTVVLISNESKPYTVRVHAMSGQLVLEHHAAPGTIYTQLDVATLSKGCFLLEVDRGSTLRKLTAKVIIQ
jgi:hypothetical protein